MQFLNFKIENFRGIQDMSLDFSFSPQSHVYTLVGLNESGKTTILEAINWCSPNLDKSLDPLDLPGYNIADAHTLIPISKRSNFNGKISSMVTIAPSIADQLKIKAYALKELKIKLIGDLGSFSVQRKKNFKDSRLVKEDSGIDKCKTRKEALIVMRGSH